MSKRFTYWNSFASAPSSSYILDNITSSASYAVSFSRYLKASYVGSPVVRLRMSSNGNQEFDFTPEELTDGTATGLSNGGLGIVTRVYNQVNGTFFFDLIASRQANMIVGGVLVVDVNGKASIAGRNGSYTRLAMTPLPYTGSNCAVFNVGKMVEGYQATLYRVCAFGKWQSSNDPNQSWVVLSMGVPANIGGSITQLPFTSFYANGSDISAGNLRPYLGIPTISNITGLNLTAATWSNEALGIDRTQLWPNMQEDAVVASREMEQIYFNDFLEAERTIIQTNQRNFYGYY